MRSLRLTPKGDLVYENGKPAARDRPNGLVVRYKKIDYSARRIAWLMLTGEWFTGHLTTRCGAALTAGNLVKVADAGSARRLRACPSCGSGFSPRAANKATRYCSPECRRSAAYVARRSRECAGCGAALPPERRQARCVACCRETERARRLAYTYGLTRMQFDDMLRRAQYRCEICGLSPESGPKVDHDHATGRPRGILCGPCNTGLGHFGDDAGRLRAAVAYLER